MQTWIYANLYYVEVVISESNEYHLGRTHIIFASLRTSTPGINPFVLGSEAKCGCCSEVFVRLRYYYLQDSINRGRRDAHLEGRSLTVTTMGRGRKGNFKYIRKRSKIHPKCLHTQYLKIVAEPPQAQVIEPPVHISEELLTAMKKMSPQALKNTLIQPDTIEQEEETYELTDLEEYDLTGPGEPVYETPILTSQLTRRIMANEFRPAKVEYILKRALQN